VNLLNLVWRRIMRRERLISSAYRRPFNVTKFVSEMLGTVLIVFWGSAVAASAQKPTITLLAPDGFSVLAPTAPYCGFDTIDTPAPGKPLLEKMIQFANGGAIVSGSLFVRLQNVNTGQIVDLNSSGPGRVTLEPNGTTLVISGGPSLWNYPPPPLSVTQAAGLPPVPYIHGRVTVTYDAAGNITAMQVNGTAENVCSLFN